MSTFEPTAQQRAAIEARSSTVLVSAGAGSGKTKVLTERLMGYLCDAREPRDVDSFLVITYTRAAAAELKGRIMQELSRAIAQDPANRQLRRQSALIRRAQISTIHGFCASLLRENSQSAHLAPDFRVIEEERASAMKRAALDKVMDAHYADARAHPGFLSLADTVGAGRDDEALKKLVLELHGKMQAHARPALWVERMIAQLSAPAADAADTIWGRELLTSLGRTADYWAGELECCIAAMRGDEKIWKAYGDNFSGTAEQLRDLARAAALGWDKARACAQSVSFPRLGTLRDPSDPALAEAVKARRDKCKDSVKKLQSAFAMSSASLLATMALTHDAMEALLRLTMAFDEQYAADKERSSLVDFADLEHKTAALLTDEQDRPTELALRLSARYTEIMVDEFQDVSRVQDTIFRALSRGGKNLFMVGDVKQSIYRFRLADPEIFNEKYRDYLDYDRAPAGDPRRILLRENFRSRREIIDAANTVFRACMSRALGDVAYDDAAALRFAAAYYTGERPKPELLLVETPTGSPDQGPAPGRLACEAAFVARKIEELIAAHTPVTVDGVTRDASYGDIAILLRNANSVGGAFRLALLDRGIPVSAVQGKDYFRSDEIATLMNLLAVLDNPHQDIPLIAALRSPCFGFTADELSLIRAADKKADFFDALRLRADEDPHAADFLRRLEALRAVAPDLSCAELVWQIVDEFDLLAIVGAMADGERRRANLMEFVSLAESFENTGYRVLHRFVLHLRELAERGSEIGGGAAAGVRILSIHKSKGLEFPIVFLSDLAHRFNTADNKARVLVHPILGLGAKVTDLQKRIEYPTLSRTAIDRRLRRETLSEEMRLLYVAMTRPKEYLFMTAAVRDPEKLLSSLQVSVGNPLAGEALAGAPDMLHWLLPAIEADGREHIALQICPAPDAEEADASESALPEPDEAFSALLERNLSFRYAHADAAALPSKVTATELKDRAEDDGESASLSPAPPRRRFREPDFTRALKPLTGAERGTATHLVLQYMDFAKTDSEEAVRAEIERLRLSRHLSDREAEAVDAAAIVKLFASPLGRRIRRADGLRREFKFSLLCDAGEVFGAAAGDSVLLQGVVDCLLEEDGELVVVDYKTDTVRTEAQLQERRALYTPQLRAYARAMERIFRKPVKECVLYFLSMGREARVEIK